VSWADYFQDEPRPALSVVWKARFLIFFPLPVCFCNRQRGPTCASPKRIFVDPNWLFGIAHETTNIPPTDIQRGPGICLPVVNALRQWPHWRTQSFSSTYEKRRLLRSRGSYRSPAGIFGHRRAFHGQCEDLSNLRLASARCRSGVCGGTIPLRERIQP